MFRTFPLSIIRRFSLYTQQWYMSYRFVDSFRAGPGWNFSSILVLLESCVQTCMTYTIVECKVKISWWWTEELSETCRVSCQNKFVKLVHLVRFITKKYITIHGNMNVKKVTEMFVIVVQCDITVDSAAIEQANWHFYFIYRTKPYEMDSKHFVSITGK